MILFGKIVIYLLLAYTLFSYIRVEKFIKKAVESKNNIKNSYTNESKIVIAIPVLREQNCIGDTVKYLREINNNIPIILITTQKEIKENINNEKTTQEIKEQILDKYNEIYCINYPYTEGYMADQLNYMLDNIENILNKKINLEDTYLALYNADSRPSKKTFDEALMKINEGNKVIQQYSYCMQNYEKLNNILKGFSIYQSNFEIKTGLINTYLKSEILYTHVVGHGLFINLQILKELGNFTTKFWCEDIYLGLQLKFNDIKIIPLLNLENMETPQSLTSLTKQNAVWFKTTSQFYKIYKDILKTGQTKRKLKGLLGVFNEFRCAINWLMFPIIILLAILGLLYTQQYILLIMFLITYLLYVFVNTISTIKVINTLDDKKYKVNIKMLINVLVATSLSNIGPIYSIIMNKKEKYKTER